MLKVSSIPPYNLCLQLSHAPSSRVRRQGRVLLARLRCVERGLQLGTARVGGFLGRLELRGQRVHLLLQACDVVPRCGELLDQVMGSQVHARCLLAGAAMDCLQWWWWCK